VMDRSQTAYIADATTRADLRIVQPAGREFRSVLATPLTIEGRVIGVVEVYAQQPRQWTDGEFKVIEWLAAQCALALQAIEYQQEVLVKRREAEEASVQKTRFLAAVSHDVRTPANAISLMADLIEQAATASHDDARSEIPALARDLKVNSCSLVELVSDVLDLTRLDTGKRELQMSEFDVCALLKSLLHQFEHVAKEKHLRLTLRAVEPDPVIRTDKTKLARIVSNLLGNAVKFTHVGAVEVGCRVIPENGGMAITVTDTGVGIPKDALPRIFDEFYQIQNPERDRNKGSGLGLAICKRLVESLDCKMEVESTVGVGTTFTLLLAQELLVPRRQESPAPAMTVPTSASVTDDVLRDVKILLVEDHEITRRAAARLLTARGAAVLEARTGREALHLLVHEEPRVLLLDLMLPDADGTSILKHLRQHRPASLECILAISGDVRDARATEVKDLGADDLLAKPINIQKLLAAIGERLNSNGKNGSS